MPDAAWTLVVHGGAKPIPSDQHDAHRRGLAHAVEAGARILRDGGSAVLAVETAIRSLEDAPSFNAGRGGNRNAAGDVELDAAIMDGQGLDIGAVAAVRRLANPIVAARLLLYEQPVLLVAAGAEAFAAENGVRLIDNADLKVATSAGAKDTVGAVARDSLGHVAAGTSTGGLARTLPGRVGDSPLPGCGLYADDRLGAVSLSGDGEAIARAIVAAHVMAALGRAGPGPAAGMIMHARRLGGEAGAIVIDRQGRIGIAHDSEHFALGVATGATAPRVALHHTELADLIDHDP